VSATAFTINVQNVNILNFIRNTLNYANLIIKNETQNKRGLLLTYLKLRLKYLLFIKILKFNITNEKVFGFTVSFFDYQTLIFLFEEIFINKQYFCNTKTENPFIIDCGSNVGISVIFFKMLWPDSKIIAFEPDYTTFEMLKKNVELNNLTDIELFNQAVYNSEGIMDFYYGPDNPGSMIMSLNKERLPKSHRKIHSVLLSNFVKQPVDFLKMDIEGVENLVIEELSQQNKLKLIKEMCIEYHHHINPKDDAFSKILMILEKENFGYQISAYLKPPFNKEMTQDILIYAYQK